MSYDNVYLYILMRTDLPSLNPGKAVAQGAHAANKAVFLARRSEKPILNAMLDAWEKQAGDQGFGTTITLGCDVRQMREIVDCAVDMQIHAGILHDPTYPVKDGPELYLVPMDTCAFVFAHKDEVSNLMFDLRLMP